MYYVYILFSESDRQLYTGFSTDLKKRLQKHTDGLVKATKHRRPLKLIYYEAYSEETDARRRELYLKGGSGKSVMKTQLNEVLKKLKYKHL